MKIRAELALQLIFSIVAIVVWVFGSSDFYNMMFFGTSGLLAWGLLIYAFIRKIRGKKFNAYAFPFIVFPVYYAGFTDIRYTENKSKQYIDERISLFETCCINNECSTLIKENWHHNKSINRYERSLYGIGVRNNIFFRIYDEKKYVVRTRSLLAKAYAVGGKCIGE